jgi:putative membrane protein
VSTSSSHSKIVATSLILAALCGCKGQNRQDMGTRSETGTTAATSDTMASTMSNDSAASTTSAASSGGLTDANIVALLDEANMADSASGAYAVGKATNPQVKAFAKLMMGEHHALRAQGQQLAQRLNLTPELPASDPLKPAAQSEMAALKAAPKGAQFDRTYIEQEIGVHKAVLDVAGKGHDAAQNADLKKLIEKAKPVIQKHLDRAEAIQKSLGRSSA